MTLISLTKHHIALSFITEKKCEAKFEQRGPPAAFELDAQ